MNVSMSEAPSQVLGIEGGSESKQEQASVPAFKELTGLCNGAGKTSS